MYKKYKILSVDDSRTVRMQIKSAFRSYCVEILEAENGKVGLEVARQGVDVILLDITMPVMDGFEMLACLKADPVLSKIPVIMVSAELTSKSMIEMAKAGCHDYLPKPFKVETIIEKSNKQLKGGLVTLEQRIADTLAAQYANAFHVDERVLYSRLNNVEPDHIMEFCTEFPLQLELAFKLGAPECFLDLTSLINADMILLIVLQSIIGQTRARKLPIRLLMTSLIREKVTQYPQSAGWPIHEVGG